MGFWNFVGGFLLFDWFCDLFSWPRHDKACLPPHNHIYDGDIYDSSSRYDDLQDQIDDLQARIDDMDDLGMDTFEMQDRLDELQDELDDFDMYDGMDNGW